MYVPVKGGEAAIAASLDALARRRRGDPSVPELTVAQIGEQMRGAVDRVMTEGALYDRDLAALALKQAQGDVAEATFLLPPIVRPYGAWAIARPSIFRPSATTGISPPQ